MATPLEHHCNGEHDEQCRCHADPQRGGIGAGRGDRRRGESPAEVGRSAGRRPGDDDRGVPVTGSRAEVRACDPDHVIALRERDPADRLETEHRESRQVHFDPAGRARRQQFVVVRVLGSIGREQRVVVDSLRPDAAVSKRSEVDACRHHERLQPPLVVHAVARACGPRGKQDTKFRCGSSALQGAIGIPPVDDEHPSCISRFNLGGNHMRHSREHSGEATDRRKGPPSRALHRDPVSMAMAVRPRRRGRFVISSANSAEPTAIAPRPATA